jgi:outer membrane protein assembly factor BamB
MSGTVRPRSRAPRLGSAGVLFVTLSFLPCFVAPGSGRAAGGDLLWTFQGIDDVNCAAEIEDQNADGTPDLVVETFDSGATGDHIYCLSGGAPGPGSVTIWSAKPPGGPSSSGGYGDECVHVCPDLDGDGLSDVLLGTAWGGRTAYGLQGTNGAVIWDFDTYSERPPDPPVSGWVYTMSWIPDADGDGRPDVFFGCGSDNNRMYHVDGSTGGVLWSFDAVDAVFSSAALGDVSGDGRADAALGAGDLAEAVWVMRGGSTGTPVVWTRPMPGSVMGLARIEDLNGDGIDDLIAGAWSTDSTVFAFSADDGQILWVADLPGAPYVMRVEVVGDLDLDGTDDAVVGSWENSAFARSGRDGSEIWSFPTAGDVWAVDGAADVTGDGIPEVVVGSFDHLVYLVDGATGQELWRFDTGNRLYWVMGTSDLNGNGTPDVFAGSQKLISSPGGQGFLLDGGAYVVAAGIPLVEARALDAGVAVSLRSAWDADHAVLERAEGTGAAAAARFRDEVVEAYEAGLLSTSEAVAARSQDPLVRFDAVSPALEVTRGQASFVDATAERGRTWSYRFALYEQGVFAGYTPVATLTYGGGPVEDVIPELRVHPNPARGAVAIEFRVPRRQRVRLDAYDAAGRRVAEIAAEDVSGDVRLDWDRRGADGRPLAPGVYFLRLDGPGYRAATKVTWIG